MLPTINLIWADVWASTNTTTAPNNPTTKYERIISSSLAQLTVTYMYKTHQNINTQNTSHYTRTRRHNVWHLKNNVSQKLPTSADKMNIDITDVRSMFA